ncbi:hypothetical protein OEA41_005647 [Lepraria neglecta]|uniref:protein S-acyltransferase n=1 Tax=Lepraria neglecta TaxID=209136 RepID=A0AAD9Z7G2_9LECA|nr:hypothetical protein OEA41_005647 [Lepraria neglecta]
MLADFTILKLFTSEVCFANWLSIYDPDKHEPDASTGKHPSPLYYAALLGLRDVAEALLDQDARLDVHEGELDSPLLAAVRGGYGDIVDLLLNRGDDVNQRSGNGDTPLARAAFYNNMQIVHIFLQHGANSAGTTLHWAAANGYEDVLRLLLENGADVNTRDADGRNALYYALFTEDSKRLLHHTAVMSDLEDMSLLLDLGASIEVMDGLGKTALHQVAADAIGMDDARECVLFFEGRELTDDSRDCRDEGVKDNSFIVCRNRDDLEPQDAGKSSSDDSPIRASRGMH